MWRIPISTMCSRENLVASLWTSWKRRLSKCTSSYRRIVDCPLNHRIIECPWNRRIVECPLNRQFVESPLNRRIVEYPLSRRPRLKLAIDWRLALLLNAFHEFLHWLFRWRFRCFLVVDVSIFWSYSVHRCFCLWNIWFLIWFFFIFSSSSFNHLLQIFVFSKHPTHTQIRYLI